MRIIEARLVKLVSDDGLIEVKDGVAVGQRYAVDLDSRETVRMWNRQFQRAHEKEIIDAFDERSNGIGWLPTELLEWNDGQSNRSH